MAREGLGATRCIGRKKDDIKNTKGNVALVTELKEDLIMREMFSA